jgi:fructokinase
LNDHEFESVIVTRGDRGAFVVENGRQFEAQSPRKVQVVDTVGAGDAFSAVFILGLVKGWPTELTLERAIEFAAAICTVQGATTMDRRFYSEFEARGWW